MAKKVQNDTITRQNLIFYHEIYKYYKITSDFYDKRKILSQKFWSLGTYLGYLGPLFLNPLDEVFWKDLFIIIWEPYDLPIPMAARVGTKNPTSFRT